MHRAVNVVRDILAAVVVSRVSGTELVVRDLLISFLVDWRTCCMLKYLLCIGKLVRQIVESGRSTEAS